jgi:hypothetical protein
MNATGMASTFPPPPVAKGVAAVPPQALSNSVPIIRTNRRKREIFFIMHLLNGFNSIVALLAEKLWHPG